MPTTAFVLQRNWQRLHVSIPALIATANGKQTFEVIIRDLSENGIGFVLPDNILGLEDIVVSFWLPFDAARPNEAMFEPIVARLAIVSSRYVVDLNTYGYGAVFIGLGADFRKEIRSAIARAADEATRAH